MKLYYCGFNGCGQVSEILDSDISLSVNFPVTISDENIKGVCFSGACMYILTDSGIKISGYVNGHVNRKKLLRLPNTSDEIKQISSNSEMLLFVTESGETWKLTNHGEYLKKMPNFALTETDMETETATATGEDCKIIKVCCGDALNLALSSSGVAYSIPSPLGTSPRRKVADIACGFEHGLLLTETGEVHSFGTGSRGQLGHGLLSSEESPRLVDALAGLQVVVLAAGGWHSAAVVDGGDLYTWGWNSSGQLGIPFAESKDTDGPSKPDRSKPVGQVEAFPRLVTGSFPEDAVVVRVSCGHRHTVAVLGDGSVWGCGWNGYGQLGQMPSVLENSADMIKVTLAPGHVMQPTAVDVWCGVWSTAIMVT